MTTYTQAFKASTITAAFDEVVTTDAAHGRVATVLLSAIAVDYGFELPTSPAAFIAKINTQFMACEKAPGAMVALTQVLHAAASAVIAAGVAKKLPALSALPAWADPVAIAEKKAKASAVRAANKAAKAEAEAEASPAPAPTLATAPAAPAIDHNEALAIVLAALGASLFTEAQLVTLRAACGVTELA